MSAAREPFEVRRDRLVAQAAADREAMARQLAPFGTLGGGLERLSQVKSELPGMSLGMGFGLSALTLALPAGAMPVVRGGIALFRLANSVRKLFSNR